MPDTTAPARGRTRLKAAGAAIAAGALLAVALPASPAAAAETEYSGTLNATTHWSFVVPDDFNGTVLLYSHGYRPSWLTFIPHVAQIAPNPETQALLLDMGYALVGSSYSAPGWALPTAVDDQLQSLEAALGASGIEPEHVLAYGTSMGGLVTGRLAETAGDVIEGALPTCGLMEGGVDLNNYQLDAAHAINELLDIEHDIQIEGYGPDIGAAGIAKDELLAAVDAGQTTPEGRARVALAAALFHLPGDDSSDLVAWQESMYGLITSTIGFVTEGRSDIETASGGNGTWNAGVDYAKLFQASEDRKLVEKLYKQAGLDLKADLALLTETADIEAAPGSVETLFGHSGLTGDLQMPVLSLHTTIDILAPVQVEEEYAEDVRGQGDAALLRQMFVERDGHCAFTPAEIAAGIVVLEERVVTGRWNGASSSVPKLNKLAASLDESGSAFVSLPPQEFLADRNMM